MGKHIHIVGIGGISLSALAKILLKNGYVVWGSDSVKSKLTQELESLGAKIFYQHKASNVVGADLVVYSAAIKQDNPEIVEAIKLGIEVIDRAEFLGRISKEYKNVIAVAGSHGKTTTTGMLATIFLKAGLNPTIHIGGELPIIEGNVHIGEHEYFITEACEYYDSFLTLAPNASVILNVQADHLDYFKNMSNLQKSFEKFAKNTKLSGVLVTNFDDENCKKISCDCKVISYGFSGGNLCATNISQNNEIYSFDVQYFGHNLGRICLSVAGKHNIYNALASIAVSLFFGIDFQTIKKALEQYVPSKRRYQEIVLPNSAAVVHDYAHHPTEIKACLQVAKNRTNGKLIVVFEPHTYSRTKYLWQDFCSCFDGADKLFLPPIYAAREQSIDGVSSQTLAQDIAKNGIDCTATKDLKETYNLLQKYLHSGNTILLLGAGTIFHLAEMFGID